MHKEFSDLKDSCSALKAEKTQLSAECDRALKDRRDLQGELVGLHGERDALRMEVSQGKDRESWWSQYDMTSSSAAQYDTQGKLNRKLWMLEQRNAELSKLLEGAAIVRETAVEEEREIARGLRERIGKLDEARRGASSLAQANEARTQNLHKELEGNKEYYESVVRLEQGQLSDLRGQMTETKQKLGVIIAERDELKMKLALQSKSLEEITT